MSLPAVLVATDLGAAADEAIRQAHALATRDGAPLAVLHVVPNLLRDDPVLKQSGSETFRDVTSTVEAVRAEVEARVQAASGRSPGEFALTVEEGSPATVIVAHAEELRAALVVIGAGSRDDKGLGRIGTHVIRHAHGPVLVARPVDDRRGILVATDFSDPSLPAVAAAAAEASSTREPLAILHSIELFSTLPAGPLEVPIVLPDELRQEYRANVQRQLVEALERHHTTGERLVFEGPADVAILQAAEDRGTRLVVIGTVGKSGLRRLLLGSVAEYVARHAGCSVLIVRIHRP